MSLIVILIANFLVFILCLIAAQACYFERRWKWFVPAVICVVLSGVCIFAELYQWLVPPAHDLPIVLRQPTTPL
jgi:hypothetical protein